MATEYGRLRAIVLSYIGDHKHSTGTPIINLSDAGITTQFFKQVGVNLTQEEKYRVLEIFHDLYHERIIISGSALDPRFEATSWPWFRLTEYGKKALATQDYTPHDPDSYLARLRREIPDVHSDIVRYAREALECLQSNCLLASAVMIGCASEKSLLELVEVYGNSITDTVKKAEYEKDTRPWMISHKYKALWKRLEPMATSLPKPLGDDLHTILDRVFDLIKTTRNEAGHPTGKVIERETVHANLILFPSYCRRIYGLIGHFSAS